MLCKIGVEHTQKCLIMDFAGKFFSLIRWDGRPDNVQGHSFLTGLKAPGNPFYWLLTGCGLILFLNWAEIKEKYGIRFPNLWVSNALEGITKDKGTVDIAWL